MAARAPSALGVPTPLPEDLLPEDAPSDAADDVDNSLDVARTDMPTSPSQIGFQADLEILAKYDSKSKDVDTDIGRLVEKSEY